MLRVLSHSCRAPPPVIHTASHVDNDKRVAWFLFLCVPVVLFLYYMYMYMYETSLGDPLGCQSSAKGRQFLFLNNLQN